MSTPLVSVCVVTYQHARYIRRCLDSIVTQAVEFPFEVIVGDDASTDGTAEVVAEFAARYPGLLRVVAHPSNVGSSTNYRTVHRAARGSYVAHVDGDDACLPGKLSAQVRALELDAAATAVFHRVAVLDAEGRETGEVFDRHAPSTTTLAQILLQHPVSTHSSMMYRRGLLDAFLQASGTFIDMRVYVELARHGHHLHLPEVLGTYTANVGMSSRERAENMLRWQLEAVDAAGPVDETTLRRARTRFHLKAALVALRRGDDAAFANFIDKCDPWLLESRVTRLVHVGRRTPKLLRLLDRFDMWLAARPLYRRYVRF